MSTAHSIKGMVSVAGKSYRIVRIGTGHYAVVRILDDRQVGSFRTTPRLAVLAEHIEANLLDTIARVAVQLAKTSWIGQAPRLPERHSPPATATKSANPTTEPPPPAGVAEVAR
jgi:hypothetical protein